MAPTRTEILSRLKELLFAADERKRDVIERCTESSRLAADLGFSSVSMLYMVIAIEEEFGIRFDNVGASDFETIGDVVSYIGEKLG